MLTSKVVSKYAIMKATKVLLLLQLTLLGIAVPVIMLSRRGNTAVNVYKAKMNKQSSEPEGFDISSPLYHWTDVANDTQVSTKAIDFVSLLWDSVVSFSTFKTVIHTYTWNCIYNSLMAWGRAAQAAMEAFNSFVQWVTDLFKSYEQLKDEALNRYTELNDEVEALTVGHQQLVQMCLHPADEGTRSKCIDSFLVIHDCLAPLRRQRRRAHNQYLQYEKYAERSQLMKENAAKVEM
jgi:hypothetical protein